MEHTAIQVTPGAVRVNEAHTVYRSATVACIEVDLHSKYAELMTVGGGEFPEVYLSAGAETLGLDPGHPKDSLTLVSFTDFPGWEVFSCGEPSRYTLRLTLMRKERR